MESKFEEYNLGDDFSVIRNTERQFTKKFLNEQDRIMKEAFIKAGLNPDEIESFKEDIQCVIDEDDSFEHFYYKYNTPEEKRIISLERNSTTEFSETENRYKAIMTQRYYSPNYTNY